MSFEILEYPLKKWILDIIDDAKIKSDIFDLLGEPELTLRYPSIILYDVDTLIDHKKHDLVVKFGQVDRNDAEYHMDLKHFSSCRKVTDQLIGILNDSNVILKMIIQTIDKKWIDMFELDKLYVSMMNGLKLKLCYDGNNDVVINKISILYMYGFHSEVEYEEEDSDDDIESLKKILTELSESKLN